MTEQYFTTDEENQKGRVNYLEGLIATINAYLTSGKSIIPGSKAHCDVFCACGHSTQEWLDHPCPWNAAGKAKEAEPHFVREAHAAITQLEHQRNEGFNMHEVSWVVAEALERVYAAGLAAGKAKETQSE